MTLEDKTKEHVGEEIESIASFVHGSLFGLHVLGIYYHARRGKYLNAAVHTAVATYDLISFIRHNNKKNYLIGEREEGIWD